MGRKLLLTVACAGILTAVSDLGYVAYRFCQERTPELQRQVELAYDLEKEVRQFDSLPHLTSSQRVDRNNNLFMLRRMYNSNSELKEEMGFGNNLSSYLGIGTVLLLASMFPLAYAKVNYSKKEATLTEVVNSQ